MDKDRIKARRERRRKFILELYEQVDGNVNEFVDGYAIASDLGADPNEARRIVAYFEEKELIKVDDHKVGIIRITAAGIDLVESEIA